MERKILLIVCTKVDVDEAYCSASAPLLHRVPNIASQSRPAVYNTNVVIVVEKANKASALVVVTS